MIPKSQITKYLEYGVFKVGMIGGVKFFFSESSALAW